MMCHQQTVQSITSIKLMSLKTTNILCYYIKTKHNTHILYNRVQLYSPLWLNGKSFFTSADSAI